jgi:hypothetical protein
MVYTFYIHILYYLVQFESKEVLFRGEFHAVFIKMTLVSFHGIQYLLQGDYTPMCKPSARNEL